MYIDNVHTHTHILYEILKYLYFVFCHMFFFFDEVMRSSVGEYIYGALQININTQMDIEIWV